MHTPGSMIKNKILHLESAKIKLSEFLKIKKKAQTGRLTARVAIIPAETALFSPLSLLAVRSLIIKRDTVMGIPEAERVIKSPIIDSAIW